ncbi:hypothetical protein OEZ85_012908 [Tetradesmus obliquus]|uniref:Uncharacterized protein n=1 Tax=Tetradesmus obliquus TaxID=3088 RepID=A0ABY8U4A9_TETOB|nr:hypothetical protein OEZ85_012908 [Tetradesmus obliquus]
MAQLLNDQGLWLLLAALAAGCALHVVASWLLNLVASKVPPGLLPLTARRDPCKIDAYFTLRRMSSQQHMWFRLLGVAGAAVAVADKSEQAKAAAAARAAGAARFARRYVCNRLQRQQDAHAAELQQRLQQAKQDSQQQLQEQAQQHAEQQALLQQELEAVQKLRDEQQGQIRDLLAREKELVTDARAKADVLAEQRANVNSLEKQLVEVKSEKASLSHELREARELLAKERGRVEVMMHEEKQVKGQAQTVSTKVDVLQQQLSEVLTSTHEEVVDRCELLDQHLMESTQLLEEREAMLQELQAEKAVRRWLGWLAEGCVMGSAEGCVMGSAEGCVMGSAEGCVLGSAEGCVLGSADSCVLGSADSCVMGSAEGCVLGSAEGCVLGSADSCVLGSADSCVMGSAEGCDLERHVTALKANLASKGATLREAQDSLSETEGKLHEEYDKNSELSRENMGLAAQLERLQEELRQSDKFLEEVQASREVLAEELAELLEAHTRLEQEASDMHARTEGLLAQNLDSLVELGGQLTAAKAGLAAVTTERDELAKKLYWAEVARDQHGAAKALATQDAIAARQALTEEKLLRRQATPSPGGAASGKEGAAADGRDGSSTPSAGDAQRQLLRNNSSTSSKGKWPSVVAGYLHQNIADRPPRTSSTNNSPRSPTASAASPTAAAAAGSLSPLGYASKRRARWDSQPGLCAAAGTIAGELDEIVGASSSSEQGGVLRGSAERALYRSSVQWRALSDSLAAASEPLPAVSGGSAVMSPGSSRLVAAVAAAAAAAAVGSGAGAVEGDGLLLAVDPATSQEWKVAENLLYFD